MLAVIVSFVPTCHYLVSGSSRPIQGGGGGGSGVCLVCTNLSSRICGA